MSLSNGFVTDQKVYQGAASGGGLLSETTSCYNGHFSNCVAPNPLVSYTVTSFDNYSYPIGTSQLPSLNETRLDSYGNTIQVNRYDFGTAMPPVTHPVSSVTTVFWLIQYDNFTVFKSPHGPTHRGYALYGGCYRHEWRNSKIISIYL